MSPRFCTIVIDFASQKSGDRLTGRQKDRVRERDREGEEQDDDDDDKRVRESNPCSTGSITKIYYYSLFVLNKSKSKESVKGKL